MMDQLVIRRTPMLRKIPDVIRSLSSGMTPLGYRHHANGPHSQVSQRRPQV